MDNKRVDTLLKRFRQHEGVRQNWVQTWQDCYDYALPMRTGFYDVVSGQKNTDLIFDSTAVQATQEFASRMQAGLTPPFAKWFDLAAGSDVPKEMRSEVTRQLEDIGTYVWEVLQNSNLDQELHESYIDLAIGTGALLVEEGDAMQPVRFMAVPQPQLILGQGPKGMPDPVYRIRMMTLEAIQLTWPKATIPEEMKRAAKDNPDRQFKIVEALERDWGHKATERYDFSVISTEPQAVLFESVFSGDGSNPLVPFRWSKTAGEVYGRGPLFNALADVKTLNMTVELILQNAEMSIGGIWQADDDGVINPDTIELVPGTIIPRAPGTSGLEPLQSPANFDVGQFILQEMRHNVKKALFNETLGAPAGTPMSATEVHERMSDLARTIGSAYGRLHTELVTPLLRRVVYILKKQGRINIPLVNGREVKVVNISPLAQAQHTENVARVLRLGEAMNGMFGPQMTNLVLKAEEAAAYMGQEIGVPDKLVRNEVERQQIAQAIAETAEQSQSQAGAQGVLG
ncbi:MAG: portal protein [Candidatus Thalassarchaeaceae archaeon]